MKQPVWQASHGSGGYKASYESVKVWETKNGHYVAKLVTPAGSHVKGTYSDENDAVEAAKEVADKQGISYES